MQERTPSPQPILTLVELRVLEGLSRGASLPLDESLTIGNDESSDLLLMDDGIAPAHARISPTQDGFTLETKTPTGEASTVRRLALGEPFVLGEARLVCCSTDTPWDALFAATPRSPHPDATGVVDKGAATRTRPSRRPLMLGVLTAAMLLVPLLLWIAFRDVAPATATTVRDAPSTVVDAGALEEWARELDRRLRAADFTGLEARAHQGAVRISGVASGMALPRLEPILKAARRERPHIKVVLQLKEATPGPPPFRVKALVGGPHARALLDDDVLLYTGDRHAGVLLVAINGTCLTLMQDVDQQRMQLCLDPMRQPS